MLFNGERKRAAIAIISHIIFTMIFFASCRTSPINIELSLPDGYQIFAINNGSYIDENVLKPLPDNVSVFMQDGITFFPVEFLAGLHNAEFKYDAGSAICTVTNRSGAVSFFIPSFNAYVKDDQAYALSSKPLVKNDIIYIPLKQLSIIIGIDYVYDYTNGVIWVNADGEIDANLKKNVYKKLGVPIKKEKTHKIINDIKKVTSYENIEPIIRQGYLYRSDDYGVLTQLILTDDDSIIESELNRNYKFTPNKYYLTGCYGDINNLYMCVKDGLEKVSFTISYLEEKNAQKLKTYYYQKKLINDIIGVDCTKIMNNLSSKLTNGIPFETPKYDLSVGSIDDKVINIRKKLGLPAGDYFDYYLFLRVASLQLERNITVSGCVDAETMEIIDAIKEPTRRTADMTTDINAYLSEQWATLCNIAKKGDVLIFQQRGDVQYGFNNHAALILDVLPDDTLYLLQARSRVLGVGSEKEVDYLTMDKFFNDAYWSKSQVASLYTYRGLSSEQRERLANGSNEKFSGYTFGFGSYFGFKETTCAELIRDAYADIGIDIYDKAAFLQNAIKALDGNPKDIMLLPDTIMLDNKMSISAIWQKPLQ